MPKEPPEPAIEAACRHLWTLLLQEGTKYRRKWELEARERGLDIRTGRGIVEAIRSVLVQYLDRIGELDEGAVNRRAWKDQVYGIKNGDRLTTKTLQVVIDAFEIPEAEAEQLWKLLKDVSSESGAITPLNVAPRQHQTLTLHEFHYLGPDGLPRHHETLQCVRSTVPLLRSYPFRFDTNEIRSVFVRHGGIAGPIYHVEQSIYAVDIALDPPLPYGEDRSIRYIVRFAYTKPPWQDFRRVLPNGIEMTEIHVFFHKERMPSTIWWTVWADWLDGSKIASQQPVRLDSRRSVHRLVEGQGGTVCGFRWEW